MSSPADDARGPLIRNLQVRQATQDGRDGLALTDPLGIAEGEIFVPAGLLPVISRFDGSRTIEEIEDEIRDGTGQPVPPGLIAGLVAQLDELLFLDGSRFRVALARATTEFADRDPRPHALAGRTAGYPADPAALRDALDSMVRRVRRPAETPGDQTAQTRPPTPRGLVAPHIDLARGREGYSLAYSALAECEPADLYVVFGTGHQGPGAPVTGWAKDWDTPIGRVKTNRSFVEGVHARIGPAHPIDVLLHRQEHSLEFQMVFLAHVLAGHEFEVAGFLTGHLPTAGSNIDREPHVESLVGAFAAECAKWEQAGKKICYVAGADLAHIGPHFGDDAPVDEERLERLTREELPRLRLLEQGDPAAFYAAVEGEGNPDRICGTTPIYLTARLAGGAGRLLHYGQATADDRNQTVSFCSMLYE